MPDAYDKDIADHAAVASMFDDIPADMPETPATASAAEPNALVSPTNDTPEGAAPQKSEAEVLKERIAYWQSIADRYKNEAEQSRLIADPVSKLMEENPEVLLEALTKTQAARKAPAGPVKPTPPVRPSSYDPVAAYQDPDSESFKFRTALESYQSDLVDYMDKRTQQAEERLRQQEEQQMMIEAKRQKLAEVRLRLQERGIAGQEANEFITYMSSPDSLTIDNLVSLWKTIKKVPPGDIEKRVKADNLNQRVNREASPVPVGVGGGVAAPEPGSFEDVFSADLERLARVQSSTRK